MKLNLNVEKKSFENSKGENVDYIELSFEILGNKIKVKPVDEDKKLCAYLLKEVLEKGGSRS